MTRPLLLAAALFSKGAIDKVERLLEGILHYAGPVLKVVV
jgi:hypothetical protein